MLRIVSYKAINIGDELRIKFTTVKARLLITTARRGIRLELRTKRSQECELIKEDRIKQSRNGLRRNFHVRSL